MWIRADGTPKPDKVADASYRCANCDSRFRSARPAPYCGLACKDQAKTIRAFRAAFASYGRHDLPEDVTQALRIKMAHALAGGCDAAARYLSRSRGPHHRA